MMILVVILLLMSLNIPLIILDIYSFNKYGKGNGFISKKSILHFYYLQSVRRVKVL